MMRIYQLGYPGGMGGANTECWHTVRLWREAGWEVNMIPTWGADSVWEERLASIGVRTHHVPVENLERVPGLAGSIVVGMCNQHFCRTRGENGQVWWNFDRLKRMGCRTVWVPCMCFLFSHEHFAWTRFGLPDAFVFQSRFQRGRFELALRQWGYRPERGFLIHGAFWPDEFPFEPRRHAPESPFVVGRLARPDVDKWSNNYWPIMARIPYQRREALCMGWRNAAEAERGERGRIEQKLGVPPQWGRCLDAQAISVRDFLGQCHCLLGLNGGAQENWPRVGLEAMAAGVPLVVEGYWGWREMIEHDNTGYLCEDEADLSYWPAYLARHEARRLEIAEAARAHVERLCSPPVLIAAWKRLFTFVSNPQETVMA